MEDTQLYIYAIFFVQPNLDGSTSLSFDQWLTFHNGMYSTQDETLNTNNVLEVQTYINNLRGRNRIAVEFSKLTDEHWQLINRSLNP